MRVFVASWFFPPSTSSEGIVTYKLLRNSRFRYDVVSASTNKWGYKSRLEPDADNINIIPVITDELGVWRDACLRIFEERHKVQPYDAVMTRCMPNESLEVGLAIKEKYPSLMWICSLADPVANNPYVRYAIDTSPNFTQREKKQVLQELSLPQAAWSVNWLDHPSNTLRDQFYWKNMQDQALKKADLLISPVLEQLRYIDTDGTAGNKYVVIPHSFDEKLYPRTDYEVNWEADKIHLTYTGYSDALRSLNPFLEAVKWIKDRYPEIPKKIKIHFFGNYPREIVDRALAWGIEDSFDFSGNVSYLDSLALIQKSDWLLHVDAWFDELRDTGGTIFFAGKLADYMGTGKPILALTGTHSPANSIVAQYGGISVHPHDTVGLATVLLNIALGECEIQISESFRALFRSDVVAARFDVLLEKKEKCTAPATVNLVVDGEYAPANKLLTVCVPAYNAQDTLRRALDSLLAAKSRDELEVIVVDDGSTDGVAVIAREYVERYPNSVMLVSKPNGGHGSGINQGMKLANGLYFRVVDSDDWVDPDALDDELRYIREAKEKPDIIYTPYCVVDQGTGESKPWPVSEKIETNRIYTFAELIKEISVERVYFTLAGTSFRMALLRKINLHLRENTFYTDNEFILRAIPEANTAVFLSKRVYRYLRGQAEQSVAPLSFVRHYDDHERILRDLICFEQKTDIRGAQRKYIRYILDQLLMTNYRILLEFDPNLQRGFDRMWQFDQWLKENAPDYYVWSEKHIRRVSLARGLNYNAEKFSAKLKARGNPKNPAKRIKHAVKEVLHSPVFMNRYTMHFVCSQKDGNGWLYKTYMSFK